MPSINDFVDHRWADAKSVLKEGDPDYVRHIEETDPSQDSEIPSPKRGLSTEWRRLLEDCDELVRQAFILQTAIDCLIADSDNGMSNIEVGKRFFYHMHSWYIHANTLIERVISVVRRTIRLYISDSEAANEIVQRYKDSWTSQEIIKLINDQRNEFGHGDTRSWSKSITEVDYLWEGSVAAGLTPQISHDLFIFSGMGERAKSDKYHPFIDRTRIMFDLLGGILHELEEDIRKK